MDKFEIRRLKLLEILNSKYDGKRAALADALGMSASYLSRMLYPEGKDSKKKIGEDIAERIHDAFGVDMSGKISTTSTPETKLQRLLPDEDELLEFYRTTDQSGRERILRTAREAPRTNVIPFAKGKR